MTKVQRLSLFKQYLFLESTFSKSYFSASSSKFISRAAQKLRKQEGRVLTVVWGGPLMGYSSNVTEWWTENDSVYVLCISTAAVWTVNWVMIQCHSWWLTGRHERITISINITASTLHRHRVTLTGPDDRDSFLTVKQDCGNERVLESSPQTFRGEMMTGGRTRAGQSPAAS